MRAISLIQILDLKKKNSVVVCPASVVSTSPSADVLLLYYSIAELGLSGHAVLIFQLKQLIYCDLRF